MVHHLVALYQNTSKYGTGVEIGPMLWVFRFHIAIKKEIFKNLLVQNLKGKSFHIMACNFEHDWTNTIIGHIGLEARSKVKNSVQ